MQSFLSIKISLLELGRNHQFAMESEIFAIDGELMVGPYNYTLTSAYIIFPYLHTGGAWLRAL